MADATTRVPSTQEMLRDTALMRLRLVAADIAQLHQGLLAISSTGKGMDALAERLAEWCGTIADVERTLRRTEGDAQRG